MDIGSKIRSVRTEKGLSQQDVAVMLKISDNTYRKIENNDTSPNLNLLEKIAKVFDKTILDFLPEEQIIINQKNNKGSVVYSAFVYNQQLSEKVIEQYENRLNEKDEVISLLREILSEKE